VPVEQYIVINSNNRTLGSIRNLSFETNIKCVKRDKIPTKRKTKFALPVYIQKKMYTNKNGMLKFSKEKICVFNLS